MTPDHARARTYGAWRSARPNRRSTQQPGCDLGRDARFTAELEIIDGNPFVPLPPDALNDVFCESGRTKGPIPVRGAIDGRPYQQTLVKFRGVWRLYVNMKMMDDSPRRIGELR